PARARGSTTARRAGDPRLRRTHAIRQRRRTDISGTFTSFPGIATRLGKKIREGGASWGPFGLYARRWVAGTADPATCAGPELHRTDEPLLVCLEPLAAEIGRRTGLSTPRRAKFL